MTMRVIALSLAAILTATAPALANKMILIGSARRKSQSLPLQTVRKLSRRLLLGPAKHPIYRAAGALRLITIS